MDFSEVRDHLAQACEFPIDHGGVIEQAGDVELDGSEDPETIGTVLDRTDETTYQSADDVVTTLRGTVDDGYIGRKYYDDRAGARSIPGGWREQRHEG